MILVDRAKLEKLITDLVNAERQLAYDVSKNQNPLIEKAAIRKVNQAYNELHRYLDHPGNGN